MAEHARALAQAERERDEARAEARRWQAAALAAVLPALDADSAGRARAQIRQLIHGGQDQ